ncbi:unnamed protein product, partial [Adineta ricciae]
ILRLLPWRELMVLRGTMASPLNQGFCTRNPLDCFQIEWNRSELGLESNGIGPELVGIDPR